MNNVNPRFIERKALANNIKCEAFRDAKSLSTSAFHQVNIPTILVATIKLVLPDLNVFDPGRAGKSSL